MKTPPNDLALILKAAAFAADKHRDQRRKDQQASPYINHPLEVACLLATEGGVRDKALLAAALLHDTVEDTRTEPAEISGAFGAQIAQIVAEVTDDKALAKPVRKQRQIESAETASDEAKQLKIADKICNIRDITKSPPATWTPERQQEYLDWASKVVANCVGVNAALDTIYDEAISAARASLRCAGQKPL